MSKRFLSAILFSLLVIGQSAFAQDQRTSSTGAVFTLDTSNPELGEAWREPDREDGKPGLVWGSPVMEQGKEVAYMSMSEAYLYCAGLGARVATKEEFEQLAKYLGKGTAKGYNPFLADGKTDLLPGLSGHKFWTSSFTYVDPDPDVYPSPGIIFYGNDGDTGAYHFLFFSAVRCVSER